MSIGRFGPIHGCRRATQILKECRGPILGHDAIALKDNAVLHLSLIFWQFRTLFNTYSEDGPKVNGDTATPGFSHYLRTGAD